MEKMNLVMTTDKNYIVPTTVTISSILSSAERDEFFHIHILCAPGLDQGSRTMLKGLEKKDSRVRVQFLEIADSRLDHVVTTAHIPVASYYRLYISQMLKEERCLFIDGDMIIRGDLSEVYHTDLEGYYAAAVRDLGIQSHMSEYADYARYLGIASMDHYVNAGFMLFNLKKIREDRIGEQMIEAIDHGYKYMDQDILNKYFSGKMKILPLKYDFFTEYYGSTGSMELAGYSREEMRNIEQDAYVMHFTGPFKPWLCTRLTVNQLWWHEAEKVLDQDIYNQISDQAKDSERKSDWKYIVEAVKDEKEIVIFGYSEIGRKVADRLPGSNVKRPVAFADNDPGKEGLRYLDIPVEKAEKVCALHPDAVYIISSQNGFIQIKKQLNRLGINDSRMIRYIHKDRTYYARLDERYREYEEKDFDSGRGGLSGKQSVPQP